MSTFTNTQKIAGEIVSLMWHPEKPLLEIGIKEDGFIFVLTAENNDENLSFVERAFLSSRDVFVEVEESTRIRTLCFLDDDSEGGSDDSE